MSSMPSTQVHAWASFQSRFRAYFIDGIICLGMFLVGGLAAAALFEEYPFARVGSFFLIAVSVLSYEPLMLCSYGATFGHKALNICVVQKDTNRNLPMWRAYVRSLVKMLFGSFSLIFMFMTKRAQALHDLAAGSEVRVRNPRRAVPQDYFVPAASSRGERGVSPGIRLLGILLYNVLFLIILLICTALFISRACLDYKVCSSADISVRAFLSLLWLAAIGFSLVLGWTGRLPGFRGRLQ